MKHSPSTRFLAILLCLCMAVSYAFADEMQADSKEAFRFSLKAELDPSAFPKAWQPTLQGISDLLDVLTIQGNEVVYTNVYSSHFDINTQITLKDTSTAETSLRIFGRDDTWAIQSPLLGEQPILLEQYAMPQMFLKLYFHLGIPLQILPLIVSPYVTRSAWVNIVQPWYAAMVPDLYNVVSRVIPRENAMAAFREMSSIANSDPIFQAWVRALALEAGLDEDLLSFFTNLPDWADSFLAEDGIRIVVEDAQNESWSTGDTVFYRKENGVEYIDLPETLDGYKLTATIKSSSTDPLIHLSVTRDEESVIDLRAEACGLPDALPYTGSGTAKLDLTGTAAGDGIHLQAVYSGTSDGTWTLSVLNESGDTSYLTLNGTATPYVTDYCPYYEHWALNGFSFTNMNDASLAELVNGVKSNLLHGILPLMLHVPATTYQSLLDLCDTYGILDTLAAGRSHADEDDWSEDEEDWSEDEEDWSEDEDE